MMASKARKIPGPDHPIAITPNPQQVIVKIAGQVVADTRNALTVKEATYGPVQVGITILQAVRRTSQKYPISLEGNVESSVLSLRGTIKGAP